jgi:hypothetical protein
MTIDEDIKWWTEASLKSKNDAGLIAFGIATGLKMAKASYGVKGEQEEQESKADLVDSWAGGGGSCSWMITL